MNNDPMTAIVEFQVNSETTTTDEWLNEWAIRAEDAQNGEPDTSLCVCFEHRIGEECISF